MTKTIATAIAALAAGFVGMGVVDAVIGGVDGASVAVLAAAVIVWLFASIRRAK